MNEILSACRENTGEHFLDSGGDNGRHWQKPPIHEEDPVVSWCPNTKTATLHTGPFLTGWAKDGVAADIHKEFDSFCETREGEGGISLGPMAEDVRGSWFELAAEFMESKGYYQLGRDNTYNSETDLDQCFIWEVWHKEDASRDWVYADDLTVTVLFIHTGCDVRGGYSSPLFIRPEGDYSVPSELGVEFLDEDGEVDRFTNGYTAIPSSSFFDEVRVFPWLSTQETIVGWYGGKARRFHPCPPVY